MPRAEEQAMYHTRIFLTILLSLLSGAAANAQQLVPITVHIKAGSGRPLQGASIAPEAPAGVDKISPVKTDAQGNATIRLKAGIGYYTEIAAKGFALFTTELRADSAGQIFNYTLDAAQTLQGTTVTARKLLMRQEDDKTIVDPEPLAASSSSGYEVLEKTPGIIADQDGNFYMTSSTAATIYINGREMKMSNSDIASMLKSLPPNAIEKIEIMRTPSSKYDASGSGGIINIVLKKGVKIGLTGSVNAGIQQGVYGNQFGGLSLNYNNGEKSAYLNMNYANRKSLENITTHRFVTADSLLDQVSASVYKGQNIYFGYGLGRTFHTKLELNYDGRVSANFNDNLTNNSSVLGDTLATIYTNNKTATGNTGTSLNIDQSIDAKYKIDTSGSEWTANIAWNGNFGNSNQDIHTALAATPNNELIDNGDIHNTKYYFSAQTDLKYKTKGHLTFETGLKSTATFFHFNSDYIADYNGQSYPDNDRTATYKYNENINAAYFQVSKGINDIIIKPGIRLENTNMVGEQTRPGVSGFSIHRTDLFPYAYLSKKLLTLFKLDFRGYLVYRRTILRPAYDYLNPFKRFLDPYLYEAGNPALRPQFTNNYEANVSVDERPIIAVGYNDMKDIFSQVVYQDDTNKSVAYRTYDNLGRNKEFYVRGLAGLPPGGKYFFIFGGQYNLNTYDGLYDGSPLNYTREMWTFFTYHNLKITKTTNLVVNGFMRLNGLMQFYELGTFGTLNASLTQTFLNKKLQVTLSAQDIFYTNKYTYSIDQGPVVATGSRYNDSQRFGINLRYNFGIKPKEDKGEFMDDSPEKRGEP